MRLCKVSLAVVALVAVLHALTPEAGAGGGAAGRCETTHPTGALVSITFVGVPAFTVIGQTVTVVNISVTAAFGNQVVGPFAAAPGGQVFAVLDTLDGACGVFNEELLGQSSLSSQILSALGLPGTTLNFTRCSFGGPASGQCKAPEGTIHTPPGFPVQITGYVGQ